MGCLRAAYSCIFLFLHAMHLLCGAGFSAVITSVIFATVAN